MIILYILLFCFGCSMASFITAQIFRIESDEGVSGMLKGRSKCDHCKKTLGPLQLIPILSWLLLRGRCSSCNKPIPVTYPLFELLLGMAYLFWWLYDRSPIMLINIHLVFTLAVYDALFTGFPKVIMNSMLLYALLFNLYLFYQEGHFVDWRSLLVAVLFISVGVILNYFKKAVGVGDFLILLFLAGFLTLYSYLGMLFFTAVISGLISVALLLMKKIKMKQYIPLVPFIFVGFIIILPFRDQLTLYFENLQLLWYFVTS